MNTPSVSRPPRATPSPASVISKGGTARSAVSARSSPASGRPLSRKTEGSNGDTPSAPRTNGRDALEGALKRETEEKEELMVRLQDNAQVTMELEASNASLRAALQEAEARVSEANADQLRMEREIVNQVEVIEKLREQMSTSERERRDEARRYHEQAETFEAERRAFYDNEGHLKGRIEHLQEQLRRAEMRLLDLPAGDADEDKELKAKSPPHSPQQPRREEDGDPAEMTNLKMELDTLGGAYGSLQSTHQILQQELADLKRVNQEIQEENESYNVLLRERTLNGTFDITGATGEYSSDEPEAEGDEWSKASGRNLDVVSEDAEHEHEEIDLTSDAEPAELDPSFAASRETSSPAPESVHSQTRRRGQGSRTRQTSQGSGKDAKGENLGALAITGPGLDLAAELGRARNKDGTEPDVLASPRRKKEDGTVHSLKSEIKTLKDANKALSLYAAKIIDRIIAQEGFEHVLAADYKEETVAPPPRGASLSRSKTVAGHGARPAPARGVTMSGAKDQQQEMMAVAPQPQPMVRAKSDQPQAQPPPAPPQPQQVQMTAAQAKRRSMSIDWKGLFGAGAQPEKKSENLRPLTLAGSATAPPPATASSRPRRLELDTQEDEEDRRERERLNATMKLMGIERASSFRTQDQPADDLSHLEEARGMLDSPPPTEGSGARVDRRRTSMLSGLGRLSTPQQQQRAVSSPFAYSRAASDDSTTPTRSQLTTQALAESSAAHALAALDAHEKALAEEIAKGASKGYQSGFTPSPLEADGAAGGASGVMRRASRRKGRESGGTLSVGSVSTVWSAGRASVTGSSVEETGE